MAEKAGRRGRRRLLRGLRAQLLLWTILPLALVLVFLSLAGVLRHREAMTQLVEERDRGLITAEANRVGREITQRAADLAQVATGVPTGALDPELAAFLEQADSGKQGLALLDSQGAVIARSPAASWSTDPTARILASRTATVGEPQYETVGPGRDDARLLIGVPAAGGQALLGALPLANLRLMESSLAVEGEAQGPLWVLDPTGRSVHYHGAAQPTPDERILAGIGRTGAGSSRVRDVGGEELLVAYAHVEPVGWVLITTENLRAIAAMGMSVVEVLPAALLFVALAALLGVTLGVLNIVRPLQELDRRAARVAWGDFAAVEQPVGGIQEIDDLRATLAQMAERIQSYQGGMRDYLSAVTTGQEDERERLAHELHDVTIQGLIALKQRSQMALKACAGSDPGRAVERLQEFGRLIDAEISSLRGIIGDLRPIYLEDLGFVAALEMLVRQIEERHGLAVHLTVRGEAVRLQPDLELAAYRVVQQAVANVVSHAKAADAWIDVEFAADCLTLAVRDNGVGFTPPEQPAELAHQGHFGLMGMRERALLYGGQLTLRSAPGAGTTVTAQLPLTAGSAAPERPS